VQELDATLVHASNSSVPSQGHSRDSKRWVNPIRFLELDESFAHVDSKVMPDTWGTVEDSVTQLNDIGVQPMGARRLRLPSTSQWRLVSASSNPAPTLDPEQSRALGCLRPYSIDPDVVFTGILAMFCVVCRDATLLDDSPPRFGGIYEMYANSTADPAFWGERWELYKVRSYSGTWMDPMRHRVMPGRSVHVVCTSTALLFQVGCPGKKSAFRVMRSC
jgi:hypothetical protein